MSTAAADPSLEPNPAPESNPGTETWNSVKAILKPFASLQLTVALFAAGVVLVFFGTVAQKNSGIWTVIDDYFWSYYVMIDLQLIVQFAQVFFGVSPDASVPGAFPWIGGKLLGFLMFGNLLAAHLVRFKFAWRRLGVIVLHGGILMLFVGEYITREFQVEQQMVIEENGASNYAVDIRNSELAFTIPAEGEIDDVVVVPGTKLKRAAASKERIADPRLPVDVAVNEFLINSGFVEPKERPGGNPATAGIGTQVAAVAKPEVSGVDPNQKVDMPSAYVTFYKKGTDESLGTYLVSLRTDRDQTITVDGKPVTVGLRFTHYYKPFTFNLIKFTFDRYVGTNTPKNYASQIRLIDPETGQDREVKIAMNEPLRYRGETFFQSSFTPDEKGTVLQVVRNPGWLLPYLACGFVSLGMLIHFGANLTKFLGKAKKPTLGVGGKPAATNLVIPGVVLAVAGLYLLGAMLRGGTNSKFDFASAARLPVVQDGRVKPLDTVARVDLRLISHKEEFTDENGRTRPAIQWFLDVASMLPDNPGEAKNYKIFRVENDRVRELLALPKREGMRYSAAEFLPKWDEFNAAAMKAEARPDKDRDVYEQHVLEVRKQLEIYLAVWFDRGRLAPMVLPPGDGKEWRKYGDFTEAVRQATMSQVRERVRALGIPPEVKNLDENQKRQVMELFDATEAEVTARARAADPAAAAWDDLLAAYRANDPERFNKLLAEFHEKYADTVSSGHRSRADFEVFLNTFAPYYHCLVLYVVAFALALMGWLAVGFGSATADPLRKATTWLLLITFALHTFTLFSRMWLMDRPLVFVTNLYSSAVFIGWAAVGICLIVERIFPLGIGNATGAAIGVGTTIIAHNLATSGDTLEMMQAVLDTNFWLATHVTTVTLGYSATYIAGAMGLMYILLGTFTKLLAKPAQTGDPDLGKVLAQVTYGIVCLATFFSFVGTVLGGIWADQSWGRFWGWDPKENGAVLIVLWNSLILHARWCGLVKDRGLAVLVLVGNMITTWSWFGTNQLGVGLHAYGFNNTLALGCSVVWVSHLALIGLGVTPKRFWRSFPETDTKT